MQNLVALGLLAALTAQSPQAQTTARVTGRVVIAGTTTPVAGAQVTLVPMRRGPMTPPRAMPPGPPPQRATDEDGRFVFERMLPGEYRVTVSKAGFAPPLPPFLGGTPSKPPLVLAAGQAIDLGDLALERGGAVAGRVLDPNGEPQAGAMVMALRRVDRRVAPTGGAGSMPIGPESGLIPVGQSAQTNDLGEFRVFGLPAGDYVVAAGPAPIGIGAQTTASSVLATTYFPGTTDPIAATAVTVSDANATNGIEIRLASVPAYRVSGVVVDADGNAVAGAMVMLMRNRGPGIGGPAGNARTGQNGGFVVGGVPAGTYRATASLPIVRESGASGGVGGIVWGTSSGGVGGGPAPVEVVVADGNVSGVRIVVQGR
jgi:Carboxypeptidase regulatory-like domain